MEFTDITGSFGVFMILLAYILLITKILHKESLIYLVLNATGAGLACFASALLEYWPFIILEGVWSLVSLLAIFRLLILSPAGN